MSLNEQAINVITRPLPKDKIKKRPGKAGMSFSYITPDFVIETLNEAFQFDWNTCIVHQAIYENVAVVGLELSVPADDGNKVIKQQFGSCEVTRGLGIGEAFKGAASDALKKCATLLGLGLELYKDDVSVSGLSKPANFMSPTKVSSRPVVSSRHSPPSQPSVSRETTVAPPKPIIPQTSPIPSNNRPLGGNARPASVSKPAAPVLSQKKVTVPPTPRVNPFASKTASTTGSPSGTQINAMTAIAERKGITAVDLISNAGVVDELGYVIQSFEELSHDQAIQVIKAAQQ